jgi:Bacterial SH3 domain
MNRTTLLLLAGLIVAPFATGCAANVDDPSAEQGDSVDGETEDEVEGAELTGNFSVGTSLTTTANVNLRKGPSMSDAIIKVVPSGTVVKSASANPRNGFYGVTIGGDTGWIKGNYLSKDGVVDPGKPGNISATGREQMRKVLAYAQKNNSGASSGYCFKWVWGYLTSSGYGKLNDWNDAPEMRSGEARFFAEYMNVNGNAAKWGLQKLPITNPYDAPAGAVVVVAAGSPGTNHPTAGDISIARGNGLFINDGPSQGYGSRADFAARGKLLGIYAPL